MPFIDRLIGPSVERYMRSLLSQPFGSVRTNSGTVVTSDTPYQLVPIRAAINIVSQDVATLPLKLYRKQGRGRYEATEHPLSNVLALAPNPRMTAFEWRESQMVSLLTWGNAYNYIQKDEFGRTVSLWPLRPDNMNVTMGDTGVIYTYTPLEVSAVPSVFSPEEVLHIKGLSQDGLVGRTPLWDFREKMGEIAATERFTQSFYGNGMKRSAVLKHPGTLSDAAHERLKRSTQADSGADNAFKVLVLEEGMDFSELSFAPEDAQLLDTRRFSVEDVCRIYNLPAYKMRINVPGAVSYASVDAQSVDYLVSSLTPWLVRIEQAVNRACLTKYERDLGLFVEHNTRALLRSDLKSQAEALAIGRTNGWYSVNDCRDFLGENPVADKRADDYFAPTLVHSVQAMGQQDEATPAE